MGPFNPVRLPSQGGGWECCAPALIGVHLRKDVGGGLQIQLEKMEATTQHRTGLRQVVSGLCFTARDEA